MDDSQPATIWMLGDPWRDLRDDLLAVPAATVVTQHSLYYLDIGAQLAVRIPGPHAAPTGEEVVAMPLVTLDVATPCGLVVNQSPDARYWSSPLALVAEGWHDLHTSGLADDLIALLDTGTVKFVTRHHPPRCGALRCSV